MMYYTADKETGVFLVKTFRGYAICTIQKKYARPVYVEKVYKGTYSWTTDHTHARAWTEEIAKKHLQKIREMVR